MKKVCFVLPSLNGGGAERAAVHILNALDPLLWDRSMYLFRREGAYLGDVDRSIRVENGGGASRSSRLSALRRFIRAERPDIVVSFLSYFSVLTAVRCAAVGSRVVFNQQTPMSAFLEDKDYQWRRPLRRRVFSLVARLAYRAADAVVATSAGVADDLARAFGVARARIAVVNNPVDLSAIESAAREAIDPALDAVWTCPVIVAAGRLAEAKNYPLLIDALAGVRRTIPARLVILGTGELEQPLRALVQARKLDDAVMFAGFQRNPWKYMARADAFVLTSHYEGFGNVLVEAMACGAPVIATSSPGTREIVTDGVDGLLVERHDAAEVAAAIVRVLSDAECRAQLVAGGRRRAAAFALPVIAAAYNRFFQTVTS
jgi:glycosyltransferase involved in cell wall biosynthesis